jgi:hypothetical protein
MLERELRSRSVMRQTTAGSGGDRLSRLAGEITSGDRADDVGAVAQALLDDFPAVVDGLVERILAEEPFFRSAAATIESEVRRAVTTGFGQLLRSVAGDEQLDAHLPHRLAEVAAELGVPLSAVLHALQLGSEWTSERMLTAARAVGSGPRSPDVALEAMAQLCALGTQYASSMTDAYTRAMAEIVSRSEQAQALLLDALFEGRPADLRVLADIARELDIPERASFVAVVADNESPGRAGLPGCEQRLRYAGLRSLWRLDAQRQIGIVVLATSRDPVQSVAEVREQLESVTSGRTGISPVFQALADTPSHLALADLARQCVPSDDRGVAWYDDHPLSTLIAAAPVVAMEAARIVLGRVLELPANERALLFEAFDAWVDAGGSIEGAARAIYRHRNTVRNRLRRIEELSGRALSDPRAVAEVTVAALVVRSGARDNP